MVPEFQDDESPVPDHLWEVTAAGAAEGATGRPECLVVITVIVSNANRLRAQWWRAVPVRALGSGDIAHALRCRKASKSDPRVVNDLLKLTPV